jgi:hypothetical protein
MRPSHGGHAHAMEERSHETGNRLCWGAWRFSRDRAGGIGWPEAVARLTEERSHAEICVASLKGHGNPAQVSRGRTTYGAAKANSM